MNLFYKGKKGWGDQGRVFLVFGDGRGLRRGWVRKKRGKGKGRKKEKLAMKG